MTETAQKENPEYEEKGTAAYKKGTRFTAKRIIKKSETEYWAETPSGFVCLTKDGIEYVKCDKPADQTTCRLIFLVVGGGISEIVKLTSVR